VKLRGQWVMAIVLIGMLGIAMAPLPSVVFDRSEERR